MSASDRPTPNWRKSTASATSECVEVAVEGPLVLVRDSKDRAGSPLVFSLPEWNAFVAGVKLGEFDVEGQ